VQKYKEIVIDYTWAYYDWYEQYIGDLFQNGIGSFNLTEKDKGYFTLVDYLPNLRIAYRGHEAYLEYIQANTAAFILCTDLIFYEFWMEHEYAFLEFDPDEEHRRSQRG